MKTILHPADFSAASRPAFRKAIELTKSDRATLELLHVMTPVTPIPADSYGYVSPRTYNELAAAATTSARKKMGALVTQARAAGVKATSTIAEGRSAERIVRAARARRADLIVMGTHGRTGLTGLSRFVRGASPPA